MIRRVFKAHFTLLASIVVLPACGYVGPFDRSHSDGEDSPYVTKARIEAQRLVGLKPEIREGLAQYENCEMLAQDLNETVKLRWVEQRAQISDGIAASLIPGASSGSVSGSSSAEGGVSIPTTAPQVDGAKAPNSDTSTNVQEAGVDEADSFRVGRDHIFASSFGTIQVVKRGNLQLIGALDVSSWYRPKFFTKDDLLIVVGQIASSMQSDAIELSMAGRPAVSAPDQASMPWPGHSYGNKVKVAVYRTALDQMPSLVYESQVEGDYLDSRLVEGQLTMVVRDKIAMEKTQVKIEDFSDEDWYKDPRARQHFDQWWGRIDRDTGVKIEGQSLNGVPCTQFVKRKMADWDMGLSKVLTFDIKGPKKEPQSIGVIGQGGGIYMTTDSLYLLKTEMQWFGSSWGGWNWARTPDEKTLILQIGFDAATGQLRPLADGAVKGRIKDQWALYAMNEGLNLAVATTTGSPWGSGENVSQNHLTILGYDAGTQGLKPVASVENFGTNEDIRAVRYVGHIAYIVTFRQTDPLYAIDIEDPNSPKILSGLKIPGFSAYMHPLAPGRILGVGFDAFATGQVQGAQISLFDTSDPTAMTRIDVKTYGTQWSYFEASRDHHAFFFDSVSGIIGVPLVEYASYGRVGFMGAQLLRYAGDRLIDLGRISHEELIPSSCPTQAGYSADMLWNVRRLYRIDDKLVTLSAFGLKVYDLTDMSTPSAAVRFYPASAECPYIYSVIY
jgi:inhibitor of cysteine peptidase